MNKRLQSVIRAAFSRQGAIVGLWVLFMVASLVAMSSVSSQFNEREENYVRLWAYSMSRLGSASHEDLVGMLTDRHNAIPFIMVSERGNVEQYHLVNPKVIGNERRLERRLSRLAASGRYIPITMRDGSKHIIFYGRSTTLLFLTFFPLVQLVAFALLLWLWIITLRSNTQNEQNSVWVGLAKETAHQLGTPTSSLLGWIEFLKTQPVDQEVVGEMGKDLSHLMKIVDRFSKIGSTAPLEPAGINELVGETVMYFRKRIPRNVELTYNGLAIAPVRALVNPALFEWVIENLLKNALDALQGHGTIDVRLSRDERNIFIDVADTGRGITRANREKIFEAGFSTKTRGWGLGLSLSRRVIEEYHKGRIFVAESEVGKGTTMRVTLKLIP
jgi:signal transduction histidine kinase